MRLNLWSLVKLLAPSRRRRVAFSNPVNGRHWLLQLTPHRQYGLLFKPNLRHPKSVLGFSFSTNSHGLRGPDNAQAENVVLGTSFAMGLSVDDGCNWYELILRPESWLNASMPVGPVNQARLLDGLYSGDADTLVYLYHPNLWKTAEGYVRAEQNNQDIFRALRWKTGKRETASLYLRWIFKECYKVVLGISLHRRLSGRDYLFNARYCFMDLEANRDFAEQQMAALNEIFSRFRRVIVVRVPIKEDLGARSALSSALQKLGDNYEQWWSFFCSKLPPSVFVSPGPLAIFDYSDFHPYDTHWNADGNRKFANYLQSLLMQKGVQGLK